MFLFKLYRQSMFRIFNEYQEEMLWFSALNFMAANAVVRVRNQLTNDPLYIGTNDRIFLLV